MHKTKTVHKRGGSTTRRKSKRRRITPKGVFKNPTVLLVEDVPVSKKLCEAALKRANFSVVCADNGLSAVELFKTHQKSLELVLMDVNIPGMDGLEATAKIREIQQAHISLETSGLSGSVAVIVGLTGNTDPENVDLYRKCGMDGCINKGRILIDALWKVNQQLAEDPGSFVDLCATGVERSPRTLGRSLKRFMPMPSTLAPGVSRVMRTESEANSVQSSEDEGCAADIENDEDNAAEHCRGNDHPTLSTRQPLRIHSAQSASRYQTHVGLQQVRMHTFDGELLSSGSGSGSDPTSRETEQQKKLQERKPFSFKDMLREEKGHGSIASGQAGRPLQGLQGGEITRHLGKLALQAQLQAKLQAQIQEQERREMSDESPSSASSREQSPQQIPRTLLTGSAGLSPRERNKLRTKRMAQTTVESNPDVLLVEDVKVSQRIYLAALKRGYYRVAFAETGEKAVELYKRHANSLKAVLMDIFLPGVDGIQTTRQIRRYEEENGYSRKPIMAHTANGAEEEDLRHYKACGMNGYIQKGSLICQSLAKALQAVEEDPECFFVPA